MPAITELQLENASVDAKVIEDFSNGTSNINGTGLIPRRLAAPVKSLDKIVVEALADLASRDIGASAAALINQRLNHYQIAFQGPVVINKAAGTIVFPNMFITRQGVAFKSLAAADYGLASFSVPIGVGSLHAYYIDVTAIKPAQTAVSPIKTVDGGSAVLEDLSTIPLLYSFGNTFNSPWGPEVTFAGVASDRRLASANGLDLAFEGGGEVIFDRIGFYGVKDNNGLPLDTFYFPVNQRIYSFGLGAYLGPAISNAAAGALPGYVALTDPSGSARALIYNRTTGALSFVEFNNAVFASPENVVVLASRWASRTWDLHMDMRRMDEGLVPNLFPDGKVMKGPGSVIFNNSGHYEAITDAALLALGFTQGWTDDSTSATSAIGMLIANPPPKGARVFARWYVQSTADNSFTAGSFYATGAAGGIFTGATGFVRMERQLSPRAACYVYEGFTTTNDFNKFQIGGSNNPKQIITGLQFHTSSDKPNARQILLSDYPVSVEGANSTNIPLLVPLRMDVVAGEKTFIAYDSLALNTDYKWGAYTSNAANLPLTFYSDGVGFTPAVAGTNNLTFRAFDPRTGAQVGSAVISIVAVAANKAGSAKLTAIGDSRTDYEPTWAFNVTSPDTADADFTVQSVGTRSTYAPGLLRRAWHEAHGGWSSAAIRTSNNPAGGYNETNNLVDPADHIFKPTYWAAQMAAANPVQPMPTFISWLLGTNNLGGTLDDATATTIAGTCCDDLEAMIQAFRTAFPTIKHLVMTEPPCGVGNVNDRAPEPRQRRNELIIAKTQIARFDNRRADGIYLVPTHLFFDRFRGYPYETVPSGPFSDVNVMRCIDPIHFNSGFARKQVASCVRQAIKANT
jgi:hypothetical protein